MRRVAVNAFLNLAGQAVPLAVGVLTVPFTIRWLGPDRFGILALGWVLLGYSNMFDLGLGRATTRFVAAALPRGGPEIPALVGTSIAAQALLGVAAALVICAGVPVLVDRVLRVPADIVEESKRALSLLPVAAPVVLLSSSTRGILEATGRFDLVNAVRTPLSTMQFVLPFLGSRAGWSLPLIVASVGAVQIVGLVVQSLLCLSILPAVRRPRIQVRMLKQLLSFGGWVTVSNVLGPVLVYLDRFAVGALVSIAAVGYYAVPYEVVTRLSVIPVSLVTALFPVFSAQHEAGRRNEALAARAVRVLLLAMGALTLVVVVFAGDVARMWLGPRSALVTLPMQILAIGVLMNALAHVPFTMLQAVGRPDITGKLHLVELPFHVVLTWLLVDAFGILGAALAWSVRATADAGLLFLAAGCIGALRRPALRSQGVGVLLAGVAVLCLVGGAVSGIPPIPGIPMLPLRAATVVLVVGAAVGFLSSRRGRLVADLRRWRT